MILAKVLIKKMYQKVVVFQYDKFLNCEGLIKAVLENPKACQSAIFCKNVNF